MRKIFLGIVAALPLMCVCKSPVYDGVNDGENHLASGIYAAATTMSYPAANFEIISVQDYTVYPNLLNKLYNDHSIRTNGNDVYILERLGKDNVIKYNAKTMTAIYQQNLGNGLNIQDIAVISETKAYISALESSDLIVFNPATGVVVSKIDLSRFNATAASHPFVGKLIYRNGYVYAACQRLDASLNVGDTSLIAIIDTHTDEVVESIPLHKKNPVSIDIFDGLMLVSSSGSWLDIGGIDAGVEMIDLAKNANLGVIADGSMLGGNPYEVVFIASDKAYVSVIDVNFATQLIAFNPAAGSIGAKVDGIHDASGGLVYDGVGVYVGDRGFGAAGVAIVNPATDAVERKIATGMPPSALAIIFVD